MSGLVSGLASGIASSLPSGIETPDTMLNLRKSSESEAPKQLYQVQEGGGGGREGERETA
jgi:splicing factor 3B subunit 2